MKYLSLLLLGAALSVCPLRAQNGLPPNPVPGKCYIRCITEDKWREEKKQVMVTPGYKKLEVVPAVYEEVEEKVMVKEATVRYEYVPAVYKKVTESMSVEDPYNKITVTDAKIIDDTSVVITQPSFARFEWKSSTEGCNSPDPRDCQVLCYVEYPDQKRVVPIKRVTADATFFTTVHQGKAKTIAKEVIVTPASVKEIPVPAEYATVKKQVLVHDESVREVVVEPQYINESVRVLVEKGGQEKWEEIECTLTDPNPLPIFYDLGSARLTADARKTIDERLYKLMVEKPFIRIEIDSHTDSRDSDEYNMDLSQRRAQSVVDYLVSKGIKSSRLVARGFGETKLVNRCANGVDCTEAEHAKNRRTEFRVLPN